MTGHMPTDLRKLDRALEAHADCEIERSFFNGRIKVVRWLARVKHKRVMMYWRYSLIVGDTVETIGASSPREAVSLARENRRFVAARDGSKA